MDIAALSMGMAGAQLSMNVGVSVTKKAMESSEIAAEGILKMAQAAQEVLPAPEHIIDVKA